MTRYYCEISDGNGNLFYDFTDDNLHFFECEFESAKEAVDYFLKLHGIRLRSVYYIVEDGFNIVGDFRKSFRGFQ